MTRAVLVLNVGSSSVKLAAYPISVLAEDAPPLARGELSGIGGALNAKIAIAGAEARAETPDDGCHAHERAIKWLLSRVLAQTGDIDVAVAGHRVVHGGTDYSAPVAITADVLRDLEALTPLAPNHQPHNLAGVAAISASLPDVPQVACFDTAFHRTQPRVAQLFALPRALTDKGVVRYGFHGLSYDYISGILSAHVPPPERDRVIVAHLGHGASLCALKDGRSIATTMGFTAMDGLPMGARCGDLDPGVVLHLMREEGMSLDAVDDLLNNRSGLLGVSGLSADMRVLLESKDARAQEAVDLFVYRTVREIGALATVLGGADALIFTAGIGENAAPIRKAVCEGLLSLGIDFDSAANDQGGPRISRPGSRMSAWVIATDEALVIARSTAACLTESG